MKGLELSRRYFEEYGRGMLEERFPHLLNDLAAGLFGSGSECYGFDDDLSTDHDFEPGFLILLKDTVSRIDAFLLERAYASLPKEYLGYKRQLIAPPGGPRHGVFYASEWFKEKTGSPDGHMDAYSWCTIPSHVLSEVTNGEVFFDPSGFLGEIRNSFASMPEEVLLKRLSSDLLYMGQSGQYNYSRCLKHGEKAAAQLAVDTFVRNGLDALFLLNRTYMPYYKWSFKAAQDLEKLYELPSLYEYLLLSGNEEEETEKKKEIIEEISSLLALEIYTQGLCERQENDLERLSYDLLKKVRNSDILGLEMFLLVGNI
ncbi:MAG: DUF4037 domain-containing protein [Erysipelotrichaceae bacterium]|nr:DUF4037 domain-containing protein [Erysipelotrichaceae bacterium]